VKSPLFQETRVDNTSIMLLAAGAIFLVLYVMRRRRRLDRS
jgi:hypothetical protein